MADHSFIGDNAADSSAPNIIEAKVLAASAATLIAGVVLAVLTGVQADTSILGGLPPWAQFVITAALPPVLAFLAGYAKTSNRV